MYVCKLQLDFRYQLGKGTGKRGLIVADTLLLMMFLGLCKVGNICCGHKMFLNKIRNIFFCPGHTFCVRNKCCAHRQTGKHLCRQQCVRKNVSLFARALTQKLNRSVHGHEWKRNGKFNIAGLLIFRAVAELRISSKSTKSREIHKNMRNPAKFAKNLTKYLSPQHI